MIICRRRKLSNGPDLNVLDLVFFNPTQSLQHKTNPKTIDDIIARVELSCSRTKWKTLNKIFITPQDCTINMLKRDGNNTCKLGHRAKSKKNTPSIQHLVCPMDAAENGHHMLEGQCMHIPMPASPLLQQGKANEDVGNGVIC